MTAAVHHGYYVCVQLNYKLVLRTSPLVDSNLLHKMAVSSNRGHCGDQSSTMMIATALLVSLTMLTSSGRGYAASFATIKEQKEYLTRYGYMGSSSPDPRFTSITDPNEMFKIAIMKFQWMAGLNETGVVDEATMKMMKMPRCGNPDVVGMSMVAKRRRRRRYATLGVRWPDTRITYRINNYTPDLPPDVIDMEIDAAFKRWSDVSPLTFVKVTDKTEFAEIQMFFDNRDEGDETLAYAHHPQDGDVHFLDDHHWTSKNSSGYDLLYVAIHELGHSLGLGHSDVSGSIMAGQYPGYIPDVQLHPDDIAGIQYIYGSMMQPESTSLATPFSGSPSSEGIPPASYSICRDPSTDAIFAVNEDVYFFKGAEYYMGHRHRFLSPARPINADWQGLPDDIDTAVYLDGSIIFFKGQEFWRYNSSRQPEGPNPQNISTLFPGLPNKIDAAFSWSGNGMLYVISGEQYYRMSKRPSTSLIYQVDHFYPQLLSMWKGLPSKIDTAFSYTNGRTYFFSGSNFYRFNDVSFKADPGYPKSTADYWLGCKNSRVSDDMMEKERMEGGDQFLEGRTTTRSVGVQTYSVRISTIAAVLTLNLLFI